MSEERMWTYLYQVFEALPRGGPGCRESTQRAWSHLTGLPERPQVGVMGCHKGVEIFHLAERTSALLTGIDLHPPLIATLAARAVAEGLSHQIRGEVANLADPPFEAGSLDVVWAEGSAYNMGVDHALARWQALVRPGGWLVFTDTVWVVDEPDEPARSWFSKEYPPMRHAAEVAEAARQAGWRVEASFEVEPTSWWSEYYAPMAAALEVLEATWGDDPDALAAAAMLREEIELWRAHGGSFGSVFYVCQLHD